MCIFVVVTAALLTHRSGSWALPAAFERNALAIALVLAVLASSSQKWSADLTDRQPFIHLMERKRDADAKQPARRVRFLAISPGERRPAVQTV